MLYTNISKAEKKQYMYTYRVSKNGNKCDNIFADSRFASESYNPGNNLATSQKA